MQPYWLKAPIKSITSQPKKSLKWNHDMKKNRYKHNSVLLSMLKSDCQHCSLSLPWYRVSKVSGLILNDSYHYSIKHEPAVFGVSFRRNCRGLTLETSAIETLYNGLFTLSWSTKLITLSYLVQLWTTKRIRFNSLSISMCDGGKISRSVN